MLVAVAAVAAAIGLWLAFAVPHSGADPGGEGATGPAEGLSGRAAQSDRRGSKVPGGPAQIAARAQPTSDAATGPRPPELPLLDCKQPGSEIIRVGRTTVRAATACDELALLAGPEPPPPALDWHRQARLLRDRLVEAELVRQALAEMGVAVSDAEVEAEVTVLRAAGGSA